MLFFKKFVLSGGRRVAAVVMAVCFMCSAAYAISICGKCGYENSDDARFCSHCGGRFGGKSGGADDGSPERGAATAMDSGDAEEVSVGGDSDLSGQKQLIAVDVVVAEMQTAQKYFKRGKIELAELFAHNALAMNLLTGEGSGERNDAIMKFLRSCSASAGQARRRCPSCNGSGKAVMSARGLGNSRVSLNTSGMRCRICNGSGYVRGGMTVDERKYRIGAAIEEYRTLQQSRGMSPEGLVWLPAESASNLDFRSLIVLKRAVPPLCSKCMGVGRTDCKSCKGLGVVECRAKGCVNGFVESESRISRIGGSNIEEDKNRRRQKCSVCKGTGLQTCRKCSGSGSFICKQCNGSGHAEICEKCRGKGLVLCRRCNGSGVYRDKACPYCHETGSMECSSCGGTGRRR